MAIFSLRKLPAGISSSERLLVMELDPGVSYHLQIRLACGLVNNSAMLHGFKKRAYLLLFSRDIAAATGAKSAR